MCEIIIYSTSVQTNPVGVIRFMKSSKLSTSAPVVAAIISKLLSQMISVVAFSVHVKHRSSLLHETVIMIKAKNTILKPKPFFFIK